MKKSKSSDEKFLNETKNFIHDKATEMAKDKVKDAVMKSEIANESKEKAKSGLWSIVKGIFGL